MAVLVIAAIVAVGTGFTAHAATPPAGQSSTGKAAAQTTASPGYDVVLLIGQSNMVGVGTGTDDTGDAAVDPRIFQWQPYTQTIIPALDPIYQNQSLDNIGLPMTFAKAYAKRMAPGRKLLLVGAATGSTGFATGYWVTPNDSGVTSPGAGVTTALSWVTAAMAAAGSNANLVGILWHQGETDMYSNGGAAYATDLTNLISYLRANVPGASSTTPFIVGENCYAYLTSILSQSYAAQQVPILNADHTLPDVVPYTAWTSAAELPADATYGPAHFSALSYRQLGRRYADKFFEASNNLPQPQVSQKYWNSIFFDDGRGLGSANTNTIPVNNPPTVNGTVAAAIDPVLGNVAQISGGQGSLTFVVPGNTFNASYSKMAWFLPGAIGYTNNLVSANNSGQTHFLSAQTLSNGNLLIAAGHSSGSLTPLVQAQVTHAAGAWVNVAVTYDSVAQVMTLYVNGTAVATSNSVMPAPAVTTITQPLLMGSIGPMDATGLDGKMAGNRAWAVTLTAAQIASIYGYELAGAANQPGFGIVAGVPSEWSLYNLPYLPPSISIVAASGSTTYKLPVTVVPNNGFTSTVSLAVSGLPAGANAAFVAGSVANSYTLQVSAGSLLTAGTYPLTVTGTAANGVASEAALTLTVVDTTGEIPVNLASSFNHQDTFVTDGSSYSNGSADGSGYAYSDTLLGSSVTSPNAQFTLGSPNTANSVANATVTLPTGNFSSIALLGTGIGNQTAQTFTVNYSDGTTSTFTQSLSNWCGPQQYTGEAVAVTMPYRNYYNGTEQFFNCSLYSYVFPLNSAKIASSIVLPNNGSVLILAMTVTGQLTSVPGFRLASAPASLTLVPGSTTGSAITVTPVNGFSGSVSLSASGLPSGVTASFTSGSTAGTTQLTLTATAAAAAGTSNVTITGTSGSLSVSTTVSLSVTAPNVTPANLGSGFNVYGIVNDGSTVTNGGLDTSSYAYSANLLGTTLVYQSIPYTFGAAGSANAASSATLPLPAGSYTTLNFLATAVFGNQPSQTFVVAYTDGTTSTFTQSVSDWGSPQSYAGETVASKMAYRDTPTGGQQAASWYLYAYSFALNSAKTVKSITLPNSRNVVVLAVTLSGLVPSSTTLSLGSAANVYGIFSNGSSVTNGGLDTASYAYSSALLGTGLTFQNVPYVFGAAGAADAASSTVLPLPAANYATLNFLGTAVFGNQPSQTFVVTYTDGTTSTFTQGISDWGSPQSYSGETNALPMAYRLTSTGAQQAAAWYLYSYSFALNSAKPVKSFTLPNSRNVVVLAVTLSGQVSSASQAITFSAIGTQTVGTPLALTATASSGLAVSYAASPSSVCTLSGATASFLAAGTCTVTASQPGNATYAAATPVTQSFTVQTVAAAGTSVSFGSAANIYGIFNNGSSVTNGGLDTASYAYSAALLGTNLTFQGIPYSFGTAGSADAASSTTLPLPAGSFTTLNFLGTAVFGNQPSQTFTVTYTDGTTSTFTQSVSDWGSPQSYSGETQATTMAYRLTSTGAQQAASWYLYAYSFALNSAKTVKSFTLPNSRNVVVLAVTLH